MSKNSQQNIFEELSRMKSLFVYKKGRVISEQRRFLSEDAAPVSATQLGELKPSTSTATDFEVKEPAAGTQPAGTTPAPAPAGTTPAPAGTTPPPAPAGTTPAPAPAGTTPAPAPAGTTATLTPQQMKDNLTQQVTNLHTQLTANVTKGTAKPGSIPTELKDVEGVKKFQQWLDTNKAGWAKGYPGGKVGNKKGYGLFGKRTSGAWNSYGQEYLKTLGTSGTTPAPAQGGAAPFASGTPAPAPAPAPTTAAPDYET